MEAEGYSCKLQVAHFCMEQVAHFAWNKWLSIVWNIHITAHTATVTIVIDYQLVKVVKCQT